MFEFLLPPKSPDYEKTQRYRLLYVMSLAVFAGAILSGVDNLAHGWISEAIILFVLAAFCLLGFVLNLARRDEIAAYLLSGSALVGIGMVLYKGTALYDSGLFGYPIFVLCTTFMFGRRGLALSTVLAIASIVALYSLEVYGISHPSRPATLNRVVTLALLFAVQAAVIWVIQEVWERRLFDLRDSYDSTLQGWARALEYRDGETAGHTRRVSALSVALARKLGCSEEEIQQIRRGAYLHDIGKMAIPDRILFKPGPLDDEERTLMQQHPELALKLVEGISYLLPALSIPRSHHENWDGSGYPDGLKSIEIPRAARIFSVVDHWDALNSDRPYRKAWSREQTVAYLRENAGRIFDPAMVEVFLELVDPGSA